MKITKQQQIRLLEVFKRVVDNRDQQPALKSFLRFRRTIRVTFGCDDAITVNWCDIWLCIETDGYCHS